MATMGVGRIRTGGRELGNDINASVPFGGRQMVRPVGRRLFMQASGLVAVSALGACGDDRGDSEDYSYILEALAVAAADIVGVYLIGVPVGTMVAGAVKVVKAADGGDPQPTGVNVSYSSMASQGNGMVTEYDFPGMGRSSDKKGKASMDTQGAGWVQVQNTTDDTIEYVKLLRKSKAEVLPTNKGMSGFLNRTWEPGEDLYLTGLPPYDATDPYTTLIFQTTKGQQGTIHLV